MLGLVIDLSGLSYFLARPDVFLVNAFYWVGWVPIAAVLIYGFFEVWLFSHQEKYRHHQKYVMLAIDVPKETEQSPKAMEHFFTIIAAAWGGANFKEKWIDGEVAPVFSLELVSDGGYIQYYMRVPKKHRDMVEAALYSAYPDAEVYECEDYAEKFPRKFPDEHYNAWGCEQALKKADYFPIRTYELFEHKMSQELKDPLGTQLEVLGKIKPGEMLCTQYVLEPLGELGSTWHKPGIAYVYKEIGKEEKGAHKSSMLKDGFNLVSGLPAELLTEVGINLLGGGEHGETKAEDPWKFLRSTPVDKERLDLVTKKLGKAAMHVKIRHVYVAKHEVFSKGGKDKSLKGIYNLYWHMDANGFKRVDRVTPKDDYFWQRWWLDLKRTNVVNAYRKRDPEIGGHHFILNIEELATLWHFPSILLRAPFITKTLAKRAEPPVQLPTELDGVEDMVFNAGAKKPTASVSALPVDFTEPTIPKRSSVPGPRPEPIGHHPSAERLTVDHPATPREEAIVPHLPHADRGIVGNAPDARRGEGGDGAVWENTVTSRRGPATKQVDISNNSQLPDSVRALFDPSVQFNDQTMVDQEEVKRGSKEDV